VQGAEQLVATCRHNLEVITSKNLEEGLFTQANFWTGFLDGEDFDVYGQGSLEPKHSLERVYDLSSLTKALVTTPLILDKAWSLGLDESATLGQIFTGEATWRGLEPAKGYKLKDVLRHESGLPAWRNFYTECLADPRAKNHYERLNPVLTAAAQSKAYTGTAGNVYSDVGMILLGILLEREANRSLDVLFDIFLVCSVDKNLKGLLGPAKIFDKKTSVSTGFCAVRQKEIQGEVHDENAWALGGFCGHAGLFGSCTSVVKYLKALSRSAIGSRVIAANADYANKFQSSDSALGWRTGRDEVAKNFGGGHAIGHYGFTGASFWLVPSTKACSVVLTNRVALSRTGTLPAMKTFRAAMFSEMQRHVSASIQSQATKDAN
jgi:CubicO group peptidase (beta-lactamase class C family)